MNAGIGPGARRAQPSANAQFKPPRTGTPISTPAEGARHSGDRGYGTRHEHHGTHNAAHTSRSKNWSSPFKLQIRPIGPFDCDGRGSAEQNSKPKMVSPSAFSSEFRDDGRPWNPLAYRNLAQKLDIDSAKNGALARASSDAQKHPSKLDQLNQRENQRQRAQREKRAQAAEERGRTGSQSNSVVSASSDSQRAQVSATSFLSATSIASSFHKRPTKKGSPKNWKFPRKKSRSSSSSPQKSNCKAKAISDDDDVLEIPTGKPKPKNVNPSERRRLSPIARSPSALPPPDLLALIDEEWDADHGEDDLMLASPESCRRTRELSATPSRRKRKVSPAPEQASQALLTRGQASPDKGAISANEDEAMNLCPFCSQLLPPQPSKRLLSLRDYLINLPHAAPNPTRRNPLGKRLPITETASFCRMHIDEAIVIPEGLARKWPTEIDWPPLSLRIDRFESHLRSIMLGESDNHFLTLAKEEWESKGAKMKTVRGEFDSFDVEQPGYYGARGQHVLSTRLRDLLADLLIPAQTAPLDPAVFMRRVLVPETAVQLIKDDLNLETDEEARTVCEESRAYGRAMFPVSDTRADIEFARQQEKEERDHLAALQLNLDPNKRWATAASPRDKQTGAPTPPSPPKQPAKRKPRKMLAMNTTSSAQTTETTSGTARLSSPSKAAGSAAIGGGKSRDTTSAMTDASVDLTTSDSDDGDLIVLQTGTKNSPAVGKSHKLVPKLGPVASPSGSAKAARTTSLNGKAKQANIDGLVDRDAAIASLRALSPIKSFADSDEDDNVHETSLRKFNKRNSGKSSATSSVAKQELDTLAQIRAEAEDDSDEDDGALPAARVKLARLDVHRKTRPGAGAGAGGTKRRIENGGVSPKKKKRKAKRDDEQGRSPLKNQKRHK